MVKGITAGMLYGERYNNSNAVWRKVYQQECCMVKGITEGMLFGERYNSSNAVWRKV